MTIAILIIVCFILFLVAGIYHKVSTRKETNKIPSKKEARIFQEGLNNAFVLVNVSLYKMWKDLDILDFDSLYIKLNENAEKLAKDDNKMNEWLKDFNEYITGKQNEF